MEENQIKCSVKILKIRYHKDNWGIVVAEVMDTEYGLVKADRYGTIILKGNMVEPNYHDTYTIIANEFEDPKWGIQYDLVYMGVPMDLNDKDKQKIFLSKILTENQIHSLYETLDDPFSLFEKEDVKELTKAKGIGVKTALNLIDKYKEHIDFSEAYVELDQFGLTPNMIQKLVDNYGSPSLVVQKIKDNPYLLADEVTGIGWSKADGIALKSGIDEYSEKRVHGFIRHYLNSRAQTGFSYVDPGELMYVILENIGSDMEDDELKEIIHNMKDELWWDDDKTKIGLRRYYNLEKAIAKHLIRIQNSNSRFQYGDWEEVIKETQSKQGWEYTDQQIEGIKTVLENQVVMITGFGGTGKSSIVGGMLNVLKDYSFAQCALAGKAASRLSEVTGEEGFTIHRLLDFDPMEKGFLYNEENPLPYDIIIVDEVSMIGGYLFYDLIKAIPQGTKLIMLCDIGQLDSIGVLNIAQDVIQSGVIPTVTLTQIHRQAQASAIITESLQVRQSEQIISKNYEGKEIRGELQDLELDIYGDKEYTFDRIINHFNDKLPLVKSIMDIQIIVPMRERGDSSVLKLNKKIQEIYNPYSIGVNEVEMSLSKTMKYKLRVGDKVINTKNNYKTLPNVYSDFDSLDGEYTAKYTPIYNGNVGIIKEINSYNMIIDFSYTGEIIVPKKHWKSIELAYAITCHKSQGSEFDIVICGIDYSSYTMLSKEYVYTAITRAKKYCVVCAESAALRYATSKSNVAVKQTFLSDLLQELNN